MAWRLARPGPPGRRSETPLEDAEVLEREPGVASAGDVRLRGADAVHVVEAEFDEAEAVAQVEAQGVDVVVGRGDHEPGDTPLVEQRFDVGQEPGAGTATGWFGMNADEFGQVAVHVLGDEAPAPGVRVFEEHPFDIAGVKDAEGREDGRPAGERGPVCLDLLRGG